MNDRNVPMMEMPKYRCHKEVWALKIKDFDESMLIPEDPRYGPISVGLDYLYKHNPYPGGYYVVYEDGYKSFSPPEAFESGYTLIE